MPLTIEVPDDVLDSAREWAERHGCTVEDVLIEKLRLYFVPVPDDLKEEFAMWERASDEDFAECLSIPAL